jgi:hypothetical protein
MIAILLSCMPVRRLLHAKADLLDELASALGELAMECDS